MKEEFSLLALGLGGAGKSTLLSTVCGEVEEEIVPTKGKKVLGIRISKKLVVSLLFADSL